VKNTDWSEDPAAKRWIARVKRELVPMIDNSTAVMTLVPGAEPDIKVAVELGVAILLDKPIVAVVIDGRAVPPKLAAVCDEVIEWSDDSAEMAQRIATVTERYR
jgi:nucleoside 2-deoxyribosyltransferase